jgi:hypothetical protein
MPYTVNYILLNYYTRDVCHNLVTVWFLVTVTDYKAINGLYMYLINCFIDIIRHCALLRCWNINFARLYYNKFCFADTAFMNLSQLRRIHSNERLHELCTLHYAILSFQFCSRLYIFLLHSLRSYQSIFKRTMKNRSLHSQHPCGCYITLVEKAVSSGTLVCLEQIKWRNATVAESRNGKACSNINKERINKTIQYLFHLEECPILCIWRRQFERNCIIKVNMSKTYPCPFTELQAPDLLDCKEFWLWCMATGTKEFWTSFIVR